MITLKGGNGTKGYQYDERKLGRLVMDIFDEMTVQADFEEKDLVVMEGRIIDDVIEIFSSLMPENGTGLDQNDVPRDLLFLGSGRFSCYRWHLVRRILEEACGISSLLQQDGGLGTEPMPIREREIEEKRIEDAVRIVAKALTGKDIEFKEDQDDDISQPDLPE